MAHIKQDDFIKNFVRFNEPDGFRAAALAGYASPYSTSVGRLLSNPKVLAKIEEVRRSIVKPEVSHVGPLREVITIVEEKTKSLGVSALSIRLDGWAITFEKVK